MSAEAVGALPAAPSPRDERVLLRLLERGILGDLYGAPQDPPPSEWGAQPFGVPRPEGGMLAALLFPAPHARGVVLLAHPSVAAGKGYFHRNDRVPFLRELGFHVVTFDHGGFGESDAPAGLHHREWAALLAWARRRFPDLPVHVWGVSLGGYFAHHALAADEPGVASAVFEQVAPNLFAYRFEGAPLTRAGHALARTLAPGGARWFGADAHALHVKADRVLYVSGARDRGVPLADATRLVHAASPLARHHVVEGAAHLEAWKLGGAAVREAVRATLLDL